MHEHSFHWGLDWQYKGTPWDVVLTHNTDFIFHLIFHNFSKSLSQTEKVILANAYILILTYNTRTHINSGKKYPCLFLMIIRDFHNLQAYS
jgi:hypothetical protein